MDNKELNITNLLEKLQDNSCYKDIQKGNNKKDPNPIDISTTDKEG